MNMEQFMDRLLSAAAEAGIETAEVYAQTASSFRASATNGELDRYEVSDSSGLSLRGTVGGKMGYASTQAYDDAAIKQLVEGVLESAELNEAEEQDEIYAGDAEYPVLPEAETDLDQVSAQQKLDTCLAMDQAARNADSRIWKVEHSSVSTHTGTVMLKNSYGLSLKSSDNLAVIYCMPIAKDGDSTTTGMKVAASHRFSDFKPAEIGQKAAEQAIEQLHGAPVEAGSYHIILHRDAMGDLLSTFCGMFSAENAQQKLSLLAGKEGTAIASSLVTIMDDPLLPNGLSSSPFDAEGCATYTKAVVENGILKTLLHDRKTARKQGVKTTGNAGRAGYSGPVHVGPTNLFIKPGETSLDELMSKVGNGLLITEVSGLHAGANPISGDFSLLSKGFVIENGHKGRPVEQITVAGNFYKLLENVQAIANDLDMSLSSIASPSLDVGEMTVSGK